MGQPMMQAQQSQKNRQGWFDSKFCLLQAQNCQGCPLRGMCHQTSGTRIIEINHLLRRLKKQARESLLSEEGINTEKSVPVTLSLSLVIIKYNKGFKRFMLKGCDKVEIEAGLLSIAHNLKKWSC